MSKKFPLLTVDIVIRNLHGIVLIKRENEPYKGMWALPGGFVEYGEKVEDAARREAREETGLEVELEKLVGIYSEPSRDPRGHIISACFLAKPIDGELKAGGDAAEVKIFKSVPWNKLAFDHALILKHVSNKAIR